MQVEAAEFRHVENGLRQDHAVGDDHGSIGVVRAKLRKRILRLQRLRRQDGNLEPSRLLLHPMMMRSARRRLSCSPITSQRFTAN